MKITLGQEFFPLTRNYDTEIRNVNKIVSMFESNPNSSVISEKKLNLQIEQPLNTKYFEAASFICNIHKLDFLTCE